MIFKSHIQFVCCHPERYHFNKLLQLISRTTNYFYDNIKHYFAIVQGFGARLLLLGFHVCVHVFAFRRGSRSYLPLVLPEALLNHQTWRGKMIR